MSKSLKLFSHTLWRTVLNLGPVQPKHKQIFKKVRQRVQKKNSKILRRSGYIRYISTNFLDNLSTKNTFITISGATGAGTIRTLAAETMKNNYRGIMVWYASVRGGLQYAVKWDASESAATIKAYIEVGQKFKQIK